MKTLFALAALLALAACDTFPGAEFNRALRSDGRAALGHPTRVGSLVVTPLRLVEDSRCPVNARCVWAGRVVVASLVDGGSWSETVDLELGRPHALHATSVTLASVLPERSAGVAVPPDAYVFAFAGGR